MASADSTSRPDLDSAPPGHPAGTDDFISAGEVLSGRGLGIDGALHTDDQPASEVEPVTTGDPATPTEGAKKAPAGAVEANDDGSTAA